MNRYKGYDARIVYDADARLLQGSVPNIRGMITFAGDSIDDLERAFHESVDYYLDFCARKGVEPAKPYSGNFVVRVEPVLHAQVAAAAAAAGTSLNAWVATTLEAATNVPVSGTRGRATKRA